MANISTANLLWYKHFAGQIFMPRGILQHAAASTSHAEATLRWHLHYFWHLLHGKAALCCILPRGIVRMQHLHVFVKHELELFKSKSLVCGFPLLFRQSVLFLWDHNGMASANCSGLHCFHCNQRKGYTVPTGWLQDFSGDRVIAKGLWPPQSCDLMPNDFFCRTWLKITYSVGIQPLLLTLNDSSQKWLKQLTGRCLKRCF